MAPIVSPVFPPVVSPVGSLVDFFIAGVQKGGTTALDAMLRAHPALQMAARKEVHFFDKDGLDRTACRHICQWKPPACAMSSGLRPLRLRAATPRPLQPAQRPCPLRMNVPI